MDKLSQRLHDDAERIEVTVSAELEQRISASLHAIAQEPAALSVRPKRPISMWWASSITGVAAAVAMIAIISTQDPAPQSRTEPAYSPLVLPNVDWNAKSAVLVGPLQQEYENLQADLKKAEKVLKEDIGL
jgi:hypothetical protein